MRKIHKKVSTISKVLKDWEKRDKYLERLEKIRIKERKLNKLNNRIQIGHIKLNLDLKEVKK